MHDIADVQLYGDNKNALTEVGAFFCIAIGERDTAGAAASQVNGIEIFA